MADQSSASQSQSADLQLLDAPVDVWHHFSATTQRRPQSSIKKFYKYFLIPHIGQLAGGLPNAAYFPFDSLDASIALPNRWRPRVPDPDGEQTKTSTLESAPSRLQKTRLHVPRDSGIAETTRRIDVASALQYGQSQGYPALYNFLLQFTRNNLHPNIPYAGGPDIALTVGNTDGFGKCMEAFNNAWKDTDPIGNKEGLLVEKFTYMTAIQTAEPRGMNIAPVTIDKEGMLAEGPGGLRDVLENWDFSRGRRPHLLYTITIGQNPTGGVLGTERRQQIYKLCQTYDIIIIEDDPYWYLQYPSSMLGLSNGLPLTHPFAESPKSSGFPYLDSLQPSYLSLDIDGRVVRLDSFSKTVGPGCRLGWMTAQPMIIERILRVAEAGTSGPSGFVQSMLAELFMGPQAKSDSGIGGGLDGSGWGVSGFVRWLEGLRGNYERRMQTMVHILDEGREIVSVHKHDPLSQEDRDWAPISKKAVYEFNTPMGGMFLWLKVLFETHPLADKVAPSRLSQALWIFCTTAPYRVLTALGQIFGPTEEIREKEGWRYFRLCFAAAPTEDIEPITRHLVEAIHIFWEMTDPADIDKIYDDDADVPNPPVENLGAFASWC